MTSDNTNDRKTFFYRELRTQRIAENLAQQGAEILAQDEQHGLEARTPDQQKTIKQIANLLGGQRA